MDLAVVYRSIVKKQFPQAVIVADRFHVIRLVNHHFLAYWREIEASALLRRSSPDLLSSYNRADRRGRV